MNVNNSSSTNNNIIIENLVITGVNHSKRELSVDSYSSNDTVSTLGVKRRKRVNYFNGNGIKSWEPMTRLKLNEIDVTAVLQRYRTKSIEIAEDVSNLSDMRNLSLSHIFPVNKMDEDSCITKLGGLREAKEAIKQSAYNWITLARASSEALVFCKDIADGIESAFEATTAVDVLVKNCCLEVKNTKHVGAEHSETTFMDRYLLPLLREAFFKDCSSNLVYGLVDSKDEQGVMPDWKLGYKHKKKQVYAFFVEVKRPNATSIYQADDDYVKLLKEMKQSIDYQVNMQVIEPKSFGLLVEGWRCRLYAMKLAEDGIYFATMVKRFWLVEEVEQATNIPSIAESLLFVKTELEELSAKLKDRRQRSSKLMKSKKNTFFTKFTD